MKTSNALTSPLKLKLVHVTGGGDQAWAAVEMEAIDAVGKNGIPYPQKYCWITRFNEQSIIVQVRLNNCPDPNVKGQRLITKSQGPRVRRYAAFSEDSCIQYVVQAWVLDFSRLLDVVHIWR